MGTRRRHLFVLLFVVGLIAVSASSSPTSSTKLGLDLKGGVELVYQGQPTGQVTRSPARTSIARSRSSASGSTSSASPSPRSRASATTQITVSLPDVTNAQRAIDQVGTTAQLYFYDWEPNLIGPEKAIGGRPGQEPPAKGRWQSIEETLGRRGPQHRAGIENGAADRRRRLPDRLRRGPARLRTEAGRELHDCSAIQPRFYLFAKSATRTS